MKRGKEETYAQHRDPLDTCLLSTFGPRGNKRRKAVRREVYGRGINYRWFRAFLRNSPRALRSRTRIVTKETVNHEVCDSGRARIRILLIR